MLYLLWRCVTAVPGSVFAVKVVYYLCVFLLSVCVSQACSQMMLSELLFVCMGGYALQHMTFGIVRVIQYLTGFVINSSLWTRFLYHWLPYLLVPMAFYFLVLRKIKDREELKPRDPRIIAISGVVLLSAILISLMVRSDAAGENDFLQVYVCSLYSILSSVLELIIMFYIPYSRRLESQYEQMEQMIRVMDARMEISRKNVDIINQKCHDIKYQLRMLTSLDDREQQTSYINEIRQTIAVFEHHYHTGSTALDYVLSEREPVFQSDGIQFTCLADGSLLDFMEPLDITTLFGNALDNAIEGVMKEPVTEKRLIAMRLTSQGDMVHIHIENHCPTEIHFDGDTPVTSKSDKQYHGFGVKSIRHIVEKYDGILSFRKEQTQFLLDCMCPRKKPTKHPV